MAVTKILVISPSESMSRSLSGELPPDRFRVWSARPGPGVLNAVLTVRPETVVVDRIDARPEAAQLEVALVKSCCPGARIIAVSGCSSDVDAPVLEQGVFYYTTSAEGEALVRAVESASADRSLFSGGTA